MTPTSFEIKTYKVFLCETLRARGSRSEAVCAIACNGTEGERLSMFFLPPGEPRPPNSVDASGKHAVMFVGAERMPWYIDILRNEKPLFAHLDPEHPERNRIHTGPEPVGEAEVAGHDAARLVEKKA